MCACSSPSVTGRLWSCTVLYTPHLGGLTTLVLSSLFPSLLAALHHQAVISALALAETANPQDSTFAHAIENAMHTATLSGRKWIEPVMHCWDVQKLDVSAVPLLSLMYCH